MNLDWWQLALSFLGSNAITFYLAKPKKNSLEIDNFKKLFDESQEEMENMRQRHMAFQKATDKRMKELGDELDAIKAQNDKMIRAINTAYRCQLATNIRDCPVLKKWDDSCEKKDSENECKI